MENLKYYLSIYYHSTPDKNLCSMNFHPYDCRQKPTIFYVQALEECELLLLSRKNFIRANEEIPKFKIFHDKKVQRNHYYALKRLTLTKSATPEEKYLLLMKEQPQLFQRIPLHYIASFLGIEPESLSRLRKRIVIHPHNS